MKKNQYAHILLIASFVILFCCSAVSAAQEELNICQSGITAAIVKRINEVRENPWAEAERLGFDVQELREQIGPLAEIWDQGLPPLFCDERLTQAAQGHIHDMLENLYYSHISLDGSGPLERIQAFGVNPLFWVESMGAVVFEDVIAIEEAAGLILDGLLIDAFNGGKEGSPLLDHVLSHIGIGLIGGRLSLNGIDFNVFVLAADMIVPQVKDIASEDVNRNMRVVGGHVYRDLNHNGQYDLGEEVVGVRVVLKGPLGVYGPVDPKWNLVTGSGGWFYQLLPIGNYSISIEGSVSEYDISIQYNVVLNLIDLAI